MGRRTRIGLCLCLGLAPGCVAEEDEGDGVIDTVEECEDADGYVIVSPAGRIYCPPGDEKIGAIPQGIEGAICCREEEPPKNLGPDRFRDRSPRRPSP